MALFGSFVGKRHRSKSDVDVLVEFEPGAEKHTAGFSISRNS
ncbi:MAG: nucleotidyltransferase domain-containing protein [Candidatus Methylomirabilis sp.]|nr:nucleotidyltransferase domain-containing protein [Candidatus Methylomirabilis sp.]